MIDTRGTRKVRFDDVNRLSFNAHRASAEHYPLKLSVPFEVRQRRYVYGSEFGAQPKTGFGTGCYYLRAPG